MALGAAPLSIGGLSVLLMEVLMKSRAQKNWKKRRRGWSNKISETNSEGSRVPRVRPNLYIRKKDVR